MKQVERTILVNQTTIMVALETLVKGDMKYVLQGRINGTRDYLNQEATNDQT